ncbi:TrkA family potassium uptake protein [Chitinimonas sp. BJYL2]|uniref:potassium channel family protein n=1 Tax=Chitinimonas sp. BJYL2 TaxID=2976696 RepID=UPI0022B5DAA4|nr:potassium channel protein [Chitinimonas sp. BJYL2]
MSNVFRKLLLFSVLITVLMSGGTLGYVLIEGWSWFDGLYMTLITLATIGYGETHALSDAGRLFTMVLILFGSGLLVYAITLLTVMVVEGEIANALKGVRMRSAIAKLNGHTVICGYGSTGKHVVDEFGRLGREMVVIERDTHLVNALRARGLLCVEGDATQESTLEKAGILHASGLVACLHNDADNLFVSLSARGLNPNLRIVAKALEESSHRKLRAVGADAVVMPNYIGGLRLVAEMLRPGATTLLDLMLHRHDQNILAEELAISDQSAVLGNPLSTLGIHDWRGVSLVAVQSDNGQYLFNPPDDYCLQRGDVLVLMGESTRVTAFADSLR